jgi:ABC-type spermidine/putrescine transport system permease subunit II
VAQRSRWIKFALLAIAGACAVVTVLPLLSMVLFSFSKKIEALPTQWTTEWYAFNSSEVLGSIVDSLLVSVPAVLIGLLVTLPLSFAMARHEFRGKALIDQLIVLPMLVPGTVLGFALVGLYHTGFIGDIVPPIAFLIAAHVVVVIPVLARPIIAAIQQLGVTVEEASMSLGARPLVTVIKVTLPSILPSVLVGAIFALARSMTDFAITLLLIPIDFVPMAIRIYNSTNYSIPQLTSANAVILLLLSLGIIGVAELINRRAAK